MAHTERMTGAEAVVKTMEMQGIEYAFGHCAHANYINARRLISVEDIPENKLITR